MNRIVMIRMPDGFNGLYLLVDHMTMDAQSLICFLKDIIELYCNAKYEGVPYPKDMASYLEQVQRDLAYEADSAAKKRDAAYFEKIIETSEPIYNGIDGPGALEAERARMNRPDLRAAINVSNSVDSALDIFHLEAEPTKRLMDFCEKYHVSLVCLLLMGLRTYFQKMNGNDDVSINTAIARRATLKEKSRAERESIPSPSVPSFLRTRPSWRASMRSVICRTSISCMPTMIRWPILPTETGSILRRLREKPMSPCPSPISR